MFSFALPPIQTILFCLTVGGNPHNLPVAVVDLDSPGSTYPDVSDAYLSNINSKMITQVCLYAFFMRFLVTLSKRLSL